MGSPAREPSLEEFTAAARAWLSANAPRRAAGGPERRAGARVRVGALSVFADAAPETAEAELEAARSWQAKKWAAGLAAISLPVALGGAGLPEGYRRAFERLERSYETPPAPEVVNVTLRMVVPTLVAFASEELQARLVPELVSGSSWCCQLFSEPEAGSDLASVRATATATGDGTGWQITGQKIWCSGAPHCGWGEALVRTGPGEGRDGLSVFMVPMTGPGVETRPTRQMTGGASFHEVFLDGVRVDDGLRVGPLGSGWKVAQATLGYERGGGARVGGGNYRDVVALARALGVDADPLVRQRLAALYAEHRAQGFVASRGGADRDLAPAARASLLKLGFTNRLSGVGEAAAALAGARLGAEADAELYAWNRHLLGAPGTRIAGGTDEIQRTIIAERGLGLPR